MTTMCVSSSTTNVQPSCDSVGEITWLSLIESIIGVQCGQENPNPRVHRSMGNSAKIPNRGPTVPVGNEACQVYH